MKTFLPTLFAILILISSCTSHVDKNSPKFTLQGEITGQDSGIIVLSYYSDPKLIRDTAEIKNGKFLFTGKILETTLATLRDGNGLELAVVFFEPRKMEISIFKDKITKFKMTGSKAQNESELLNKMENPFHEKISMLRDQYNKINDSIKNSKNDSVKILLEKKIEEIDKMWSQTKKKIDSTEIKYILDNPRSFISAVYLNMLEANEVISLDSTKSIFKGLDNTLKNSRYGKEIIERNRKMENILIGAQAPDFKAIDLKKQIVTLSQFKGKSVVLLDFWASWCVPCRESIPHLKKIYNKYHSKGLEVVAVSEDMNRKAWIDAVIQDSTGMWYHIPVAERYAEGPSQITNDDIYQNYFVQAIPVTMLIDKNGRIIFRHVGYSKESESLLDKQLSQLFDK
jgi:thiol-disulfide isomerase/thioredoxin